MGNRVFLVILISLFMGQVIQAQETEVEAWDVVTRCLPDPITPEENWTFEGEILLGGWAGIHAVSSRFNTPYVLHWGYGLISPDGQWVLNQDLEIYHEQLSGPGPQGRTRFYYGDITATHTGTGNRTVFPWESYITITSRPYLFGPSGPLWLDNTHFVSFYGIWGSETRIANVETGETTSWDTVSLDDYEISISPDMSRAVSDAQLYDLSDGSRIREEFVATPYDFIRSVWSTDSSMFVDIIQDHVMNTKTISIFDRDGNPIASPFVIQAGGIYLEQWSPNNEYFLFSVVTTNPYKQETYMISMSEQIIYNVCYDRLGGWAWSPDGEYFATVMGIGQAPVVIVNLDEWQPRIAAYHTGGVFMWRSN